MGVLYGAFTRRVGLPAPVVAQVRRRRDVPVPLADGVVTLADHWTPVGVEQAPLVLIRTPYGRRLFNFLVGRLLAHQGFQVLIQASRGTDRSAGVFDDPFGCEIADGAATVEWLRQQPFYPGRFFTIGDSYLGYTQLALAEAAGDDLAGAVLRVAPSSLYDMVWPGGALFLKAVLGWSVMAQRDPRLGLRSLIAEKRRSAAIDTAGMTGPLSSSYQAVSRGPIAFWDQWLQHPNNDDGWWDRFELRRALDVISCPVLVQGGWYDLFLDDSVSQYQRLAARGVPVELNLGPWTHGDMLTKGLGASMTDAVAFLRDVAGIEPRAAITKPVRLLEIGSKTLLSYDRWPAPAQECTLHLGEGGRLSDEVGPPGTVGFLYDPADPTPRVGGASNDAESGAKDNTALERRADVVTFTSQPLAAELRILGSPRVALSFASDRSDTAVFVRLCQVTADGTSRNITDRLVLLHAAERVDGQWTLEVTLPPTCITLSAGQRLRLQLSSGAYPRFARHPGTAEPPGIATDFLPASQQVLFGAGTGATVRVPLREAVGAPDGTRAPINSANELPGAG
ncbi:MAG: CocE/NonD family hydrolase [Actinomycetota bacterium]|nr:CocE/NonD family hydrolase [Actinomycetota bacterium]